MPQPAHPKEPRPVAPVLPPVATVPSGLPAYAELHCRSNFSFLTGASHPEELVARAAQLGYAALAITDECSLAGVVRAHEEVKQQRAATIAEGEADPALQLIIGSEFRLAGHGESPGCRLVLLAMNREGYAQLGALITLGRCRSEKGSYRLSLADIDTSPLPDCLALLIPRREDDASTLIAQARWLAARFGLERAAIAVELLLRADDGPLLERLQAASQVTALPLAAAGDVLMHLRSRKALQDTLTAIRLKTPLVDCGLALMPNAEQHLRPLLTLARLYRPEWLQTSVDFARRCNFSLAELRYEYPQEIVPAGATPTSYLRAQTLAGAQWRYPQGLPDKVRAQIEQELALVAELGYEAFFLTVHDIVNFARGEGILCQGRGSAANSVVCYCLGITEVDPEQSHPLLARFLSRERREPPDIDVDFEHERREEVIQYIYRKYGASRTALAAALATYRVRSAVRDVGKALGMDEQRIDRLARSHQWFDSREQLNERLAEAGFDIDSPVTRLWLALTTQLLGFPRHLSQHVGGFVIARDALSRMVPIENASMPNRKVIQWDKDGLESLGLLKVDVLALGMLSALRRSLDLINTWRGRRWTLQDIPRDDKATYAMICKADTAGVFQIESRAQQSMLPRLRPEKFYDLVVEVAIVRPGPIKGGMVHPYLKRRQKLEPSKSPKPELDPALERTLGVPIFQEQVMQVCMIAAGFSGDEADALRRSMAAWQRKGGVHHFQDRVIGGMVRNGYELAFAEQIFKQITGFGDYGFPESHAYGFALLAYLSAWLKCHEPAIFCCALLNSQPMGFYSPSQLVQDARRHGIEVRPMDVAASDWDCTLEAPDDSGTQPAVRLGLRLVSGLSRTVAERIVQAREAGSFASLPELAQRAGLEPAELQTLARADALKSLAGHRRQQVWGAAGEQRSTRLLKEAPAPEAVLELPAAPEGKEITLDYAATGLTLRRHPLALLRPRLARRRWRSADELIGLHDGAFAWACGIVVTRQQPETANGTIFVTLEDETGSVNVIVWKRVRETQRQALLASRLLAVAGQWQTTDGVSHLVARRLVDVTAWLGPLGTSSRDFH
ncbi:error-prone DNA polymerase [Rivibacter subsaxonicus]|uniref:Error-prone DNA polymerase n=1 Tax=Rivibacter subsaxonicus TaxID=457575 RepID=A0A4Q7VAX6_9BURK|nr:error-prone DNA polymerase [Rivibacter subsaxonicus]RZT93765.1 error-prone DNA polymerase [Rivibacter subsaxonicus]